MDWTPLIGRPRPAEADALRLMVVIHRLGERRDGSSQDDLTPGPSWRLIGEESLLQLEHLLRHPRLLAHLLIYLFDHDPSWAPRRAAVSRRVRQLIEIEERRGVRGRRRGTLGASLDFPASARWRRLDDTLAVLTMRGLLRLETPADGAQDGLVYELLDAGAELLEESFYSEGEDAARLIEVSSVVREFLPRWDGSWLSEQIGEAREAVASFRFAEQIPLERPVLPELFLVTFDERL